MTVWQKIAGLATAVGGAGGSLLQEFGAALGVNQQGPPEQDVAFTIAVIALSAKMAKADGIVSLGEREAFETTYRFAPDQAANVRRVYDLAKQDVAGFESYADQIAALLKDNKRLLQHVLEGLLNVAAADGILHPKEDAFLKAVSQRFGFSDSEFRFLRARFVVDHDSPYDVLRLSPDASNGQIKAQYRTLVRNNHPDSMMASGVPAAFIELANRKLAAINAAYATIAKERGL
jgi:DnaJ like chaperone protein